uniref:Murine leukemia virus integrase C-terminal domain-containing protein n=1 Tax=Denticeps clupeoides TaxID=299321 RepID=A0AAY4BTN7_9TELE
MADAAPAEIQLHHFQPGDFVLIKSFRRQNWNHQHWMGPFQILLLTHTAVKIAERAMWIHQKVLQLKQTAHPSKISKEICVLTATCGVPSHQLNSSWINLAPGIPFAYISPP